MKVAVCSRSFSRHPVLRTELLSRYQNVTFNDEGRTLADKTLVNFLKGHSKAIIGLEKIDAGILQQLPDLNCISKYGVGLDGIDTEALKHFGVKLGWKGGVNRRSVSELVIAMALSLLRDIPGASGDVKNGIWQQRVGRLLSGRKVGIIGCGFIGKDLVELLQPWNCEILAYDTITYEGFYRRFNVKKASLEELLMFSDVVTLHLPFDKTTAGILSAERLSLMQPSSILINAARGGLVNESALKDMLVTGKLAAAAFDVFANEPPEDRSLIELPNFIALPHVGGSAAEAILAMGRSAIEGLDNPNSDF